MTSDALSKGHLRSFTMMMIIIMMLNHPEGTIQTLPGSSDK